MKPRCSLPCSQQPTICLNTQTNPFNVPTSLSILKNNFSIIVPSMPVYSKLPVSLLYHHENPVSLSPYPKCPKCSSPSHLPSLKQMHNNVQQFRSWSSPLCCLLHTTPTDCSWQTPTLNIANYHMYPLCNKNQSAWNCVSPEPEVTWHTVAIIIRVVSFPILVHSWRFCFFHSLQSITPRIY